VLVLIFVATIRASSLAESVRQPSIRDIFFYPAAARTAAESLQHPRLHDGRPIFARNCTAQRIGDMLCSVQLRGRRFVLGARANTPSSRETTGHGSLTSLTACQLGK
jgi:hypothetical protein